MKPLVYPFTYEEWLAHPSTKPKIAWCKKMGKVLDKMREKNKNGKQLKLNL